MQRKIITVVTHNKNAGLVYQRLHLPFRHLKDIYDFRFIDIDEVGHSDLFYSDALVFCHAHTSDFLYLAQRAKHHYSLPLIVDLDDLLTSLPIDHPEYGQITGRCVPDILMHATKVVYSTPFLKQKLLHFNKSAFVIENTLPAGIFKNYTQPKRPHKTSFTVGWTGGKTHSADILHTFQKGLREFLIKHDDTRAYFHGICPSELHRELGAQVYFDPEYVDFMDYHAKCEKYPFDVCLVGLINHEFNDAKSDLRLVDMAPHEIPVIASPRADFIKHKDKNICLYADDSDPNYMTWFEALEYAKSHPEEMKQMAARAKEFFLSERLSTDAAEKWFEVIEQALHSKVQTQQMGRSLLAHSLELVPID